MSEIGGKTVSEFCAQFVAEALDKDLGVPAILKKTGSQLFTEPLADDLDVLTILRKTLSEFCTQTGSKRRHLAKKRVPDASQRNLECVDSFAKPFDGDRRLSIHLRLAVILPSSARPAERRQRSCARTACAVR